MLLRGIKTFKAFAMFCFSLTSLIQPTFQRLLTNYLRNSSWTWLAHTSLFSSFLPALGQSKQSLKDRTGKSRTPPVLQVQKEKEAELMIPGRLGCKGKALLSGHKLSTREQHRPFLLQGGSHGWPLCLAQPGAQEESCWRNECRWEAGASLTVAWIMVAVIVSATAVPPTTEQVRVSLRWCDKHTASVFTQQIFLSSYCAISTMRDFKKSSRSVQLID